MDDIMRYFMENPNMAEVIDKAIWDSPDASKAIESLLMSNIRVINAVNRVVNSDFTAKKELEKMMSQPKVVQFIQQAIFDDKDASQAVKNAIKKDDYCRSIIFEEISNANEDVQDLIVQAIEKSEEARALVRQFIVE